MRTLPGPELRVKTNVYIDGYNLYYGSLRGTPYRWLDVRKFAAGLVQHPHTLGRVRYFTARVRVEPAFGNGTQLRQQVYLRALDTLGIDIHYGRYQSKPTKAVLHPIAKQPVYVTILKNEEKGSDVNLASYLLLDGVRRDYEQAIVVSNDSDLATPIQMVRDELKMPIGIAFPCTNPDRQKSVHLSTVAKFYINVRKPLLKSSQLDEHMKDATGAFSRPPRWR